MDIVETGGSFYGEPFDLLRITCTTAGAYGTAKVKVKTKGIPSNSQDIIQAHAHAIEAYIHNYVGLNPDTGEAGNMYFNRTLEDWIGYKIDNRTKFDLTISSGLALLAAQKVKKKKISNFDERKFFRRYKVIG